MLLTPWARFCDASLEAEYQQEKRQRLAQADMRSAVAFVLLWAYDVWRFLGATPLALLQASVWMAAVGLKPVYVMLVAGKEFYLQYRAWIISFTKVVFAVHPPGEGLHLVQMARRGQALGGGAAAPGLVGVLWELANGLRLPYMLVTGLGWCDFFFTIPVQLALVGRAIRDNQAQCAAPFFCNPQVQALLRGLADRLASLLSTSLSVGAGIKGQQATFPAGLDPCRALGAWAAVCFGFLLTTLALATSERAARASFARRHAARLTEGEREVWGPSSGGGGWAPWALFSYICLLTWQAVVAAYVWAEGEGMGGLDGYAGGGGGANASASS
ncbi:expressed protein [Chlorella variabilis]|uniref:Expressed protein n=1 Tax=Chlorella variabilis TaxID=554065 RepID=E1ZL34_CHLVA|nr:expressed protein [Chlorella variabilis]EFN53589.1 expressed protein [Chlorella variabilis]|eukprot:XP_005845691.1 expressed protein [Chlorella variabilis]